MATEKGDNRFRFRVNNYKSVHKKLSHQIRNGTLKTGRYDKPIAQEFLHRHFAQEDHNGFDDFSFKIIDSADDLNATRRKESFWQFKLKTFQPEGLNDHCVTTHY